MWLVRTKWVVLWSLWAARLLPQPTEPVRVTSGLLRGVISPVGDHVSYTGIPYATVKRFQAPGPAPLWENVFNAFNENVRCQQALGGIITVGQENCLTLNVYTPITTHPDAKYPVMVFIHGGGYFEGSAAPMLYGPRYLVSKGVILVSFNYRLNIQGFLCLGIKEAPGNAALKDAVAALRWVRDNIKSFGGDPDSVTIFGESAGASSVSFLLLSPMAKGLFHRAITQSGSSLAPWAYQFNPVHSASLLAKTMLYETRDPRELYKFFMTKSDDELILTRVPRLNGTTFLSELLYTGCAEKIIDGVEPFLTESPYDILANGTFHKVPMMVGATTEEGLYISNMESDAMMRNVEFEKALPNNLELSCEEVGNQIAGTLKKFYYGNSTEYDAVKLSKLYGEPNFMSPGLEEVEFVLKSSDQPIYTYVFNYSGWRNLPKNTMRSSLRFSEKATHADDLFYLFSQEYIPSMLENKMIDKVTTLWTNFAKYGNPTPKPSELIPIKWKPVDPAAPASLLIDQEFSTVPMWYTDSLRYLRDVYAKYRRRK